MSAADVYDGSVDEQSRAGGRPKRRVFSAEYKARILAEYEAATEPGAKGALLRREGLYSSLITEWRRAARAGSLAALEPQPSGPEPSRTAEQVEIERLRAENARLAGELDRTKTALEITGKVHALLEGLSESADTEKQ